MARLMHCEEMRARRAPPNSQSLGVLVSSRFRLDGAKFWIMCSSTNMVLSPCVLTQLTGIGVNSRLPAWQEPRMLPSAGRPRRPSPSGGEHRRANQGYSSSRCLAATGSS